MSEERVIVFVSQNGKLSRCVYCGKISPVMKLIVLKVIEGIRVIFVDESEFPECCADCFRRGRAFEERMLSQLGVSGLWEIAR